MPTVAAMAQALARERLGFQRFPLVTAVVFTATAATSVLGLVYPRVLEALERTPQGLHGDCWPSGSPDGAGGWPPTSAPGWPASPAPSPSS